MKKKIIIGLLMVSALSFGAGNMGNMGNHNNTQRGTYQTQMMSDLSEKQQVELTKTMTQRREKNYKMGLEVRTKDLELEKLLAEDKVNWKSVEKINKEISDMKAEQRLEGMKFRKEIEGKYGISMGHSHRGGMNNQSNGRHNGNGQMRNNMGNRNN